MLGLCVCARLNSELFPRGILKFPREPMSSHVGISEARFRPNSGQKTGSRRPPEHGQHAAAASKAAEALWRPQSLDEFDYVGNLAIPRGMLNSHVGKVHCWLLLFSVRHWG